MIRIGVVNIDVSHPKAFSEYLIKGNRARYVAVYNDGFRGDDEVDAFIRKYGLEKRCNTIDELSDCVDIGFIQSCNWDNHIEQAMPFIERGKPVFIDKPIVGNIADCQKLEELVNNDAIILGSSSVRYCMEVEAFNTIHKEEKGDIVNIYGTSGVDEFNYGIHIVEAIGGLVGSSAIACKYIGKGECGEHRAENFSIRFKNGVSALYTTYSGLWQPFELVIMTTKSTYQFQINTKNLYSALLDRICDYMENGQNNFAGITELTESVKIMLAGRISRANGGTEVSLSDIPADNPGYDGTKFEKEYAATATKIYIG